MTIALNRFNYKIQYRYILFKNVIIVFVEVKSTKTTEILINSFGTR